MIPSARLTRKLVAVLTMAHGAASSGADFNAPLELARRINHDSSCTRVTILGPCLCAGLPCGWRVSTFVPVAFVETVRRPGDSLLAGALLPDSIPGGATGTMSSRQANLDHTAEVHAWALGDLAWQLGGASPCPLCRPSDALVPTPPAPPAPLPCEPAASVAIALLSAWQPWLPALAYASELDEFNWRTGCRDLQWLAAMQMLPSLPLGQWGPLYPRQMRDLGTSALVYSAKTAYRALSIARDQLASFAAPVDLAGRMQQAFPAMSACFAVGAQPLPQAPFSPRPVQVSADGRYGWFYWRPVTCCVGAATLARCTQAPAPPAE